MTSPDFRAGLLRAAEIAKNVQDAMWTKWSTTALEQFVLARNIVVEAIRAEAAAIKDEPTTVEIAPPGKHTIISSPQAPLSFKDEPQRSAVESKSQRELNHLRNALDRLNDDCLRAERERDQLRERNARLVEALRLIGQKDHKGRPGWSAGAANKLANEALAA